MSHTSSGHLPSVSATPQAHDYAKDVCVIKLERNESLPLFVGRCSTYLTRCAFQSIRAKLKNPTAHIPSPESTPASTLCILAPMRHPIYSIQLKVVPSILSLKRCIIRTTRTTKETLWCTSLNTLIALTTTGCLTRFKSHIRQHLALVCSRGSAKAAIYSYHGTSPVFQGRRPWVHHRPRLGMSVHSPPRWWCWTGRLP